MSSKYPTSAEAAPRSTTMPFMAWIAQADPDFQSDKHRQIEYETTRRFFFGDPYRRGAYAPNVLVSELGGQTLVADDGTTVLMTR